MTKETMYLAVDIEYALRNFEGLKRILTDGATYNSNTLIQVVREIQGNPMEQNDDTLELKEVISTFLESKIKSLEKRLESL